MSYHSSENLEVWEKACQLSVDIYHELKECKNYSFRDQMQRSSISIASNISEGSERGSKKEYIRFLHIAKGSAAELRTQLYIADKVGIITSKKRTILCEIVLTISKMLHSQIKSLTLNP